MNVRVAAVYVLDGKGKRIRVEGEPYRRLVEDVVIRPERGSMGEVQFTNMSGRARARAIENQVKGVLQDSGDLFPTE
ncbi:hypothetical protein HZB58_03805 [Candidatus Gottesmanbacteria bacterium]|nr:hypothetical protein [Candidatus Gottesmanbacteria bacterium]